MNTRNQIFNPWVGSSYQQGFNNKKLLVLGESHYCASPEEAHSMMTEEIIKDLWNTDSPHEHYKNTYTKFERALSGKALTYTEKKELWNNIAFYNYVQSPISGARKEPTAGEFTASEPAFLDTINHLQPDCIIVWGKRLYNNLPKQGYQLPDLQLPNGDVIETWAYTLKNGKEVSLLPITHPSAAFVPDYWHEAIQAFLNR